MCADWNRQPWPYSTDTMQKQRPIKAAPEEPNSFFSAETHYGGGDGGYVGGTGGDSDLHHTIDPTRMPYSGLGHVPEHTQIGVGPPQHHPHQPLQPMPHQPHQATHPLQHHPQQAQSTPQTQNAAPPAPQAPQAPAPKTPTQPNPKKRPRPSGSAKAAGSTAAGGTAEAGPSGSPPKRSRTNTAWTQQEEQLLKQMRDQGSTWSEIAKSFPSRTEGSVKKHWYKDMHWAEFGEEESAQLLAAIKEYDANKWKVIGQKLGKPAKACEAYAKDKFAGKF